ncbi:branched-chain amino acid ABC transporter substrate-binding protein [Actinoplanes sp. TBRC 11911]|uniref:branched-chain amino acid ABC transporter substrate-binding protein n=1 Tax=Actinoplanes sp. TBRC 11911 TaxID=2729386 RepID=UPI00145EDBD8|nr:branched-chain amino acid ABC transporter substrate-binding protein [Actinoplanes sp. TBRC 11911]NMO54789.1 branched-chain amino acid ABC transporter substrate-binding protein [Actinoplanes sp. TBRC 11911]
MRRVLRVVGAVAVAGLIAGASACASSDTQAADGSPCGYKLAFFGALSGSAANLGVNIEQGYELALDQYAQTNGSDCVEVAKFDSRGDPAVAAGVAHDLVEDKKIIGVVGPLFTGESGSADPIFDKAGVPTITPGATGVSLATSGWSTFHRAIANDAAQGPAAASYIQTTLGAKKVFVADDGSPYGTSLSALVKAKLGALVAGTDETAADGAQTDFSTLVQKVTSSGATVLFYGGYYANAGLIRKQLTASGWTGTLVGGDALNDPGLSRAAGNAAAAGTVAVCPCSPPEAADSTFGNQYRARWGHPAGTYSDTAFDATQILLEGIAAGDTTREKLNAYLSTIDHKGVSYTYKFTPTGELVPNLIKIWAFKFDGSGVPQPDRKIVIS